jgi:hypothetical protein
MNRSANGACAARARSLVNGFDPGSGEPVENGDQLVVSIWPNPAVGYVRLHGDVLREPGATARVCDLAGRTVHSLTTTDPQSGTITWNLISDQGEHLARGSYLVVVSRQRDAWRTLSLLVVGERGR